MTLIETELPNSKAKLQEGLQAGSITWAWPVMIVFVRLILAIVAQVLVAGLFKLQGHPTPMQAAAPWWPVYGTLIDIGSLLLLTWLVRKEGLRLFNLLSFRRKYLRRDLLLSLGLGILIPSLLIIGGIIFGSLIYGTASAPIPFGPLPLWGALYALLVWPIIWAIAEEMTYQGYALPRLEVLSGRAWPAVLIVGFGWAIQHSALPIMPDWRWAAFRFVSALPIAILAVFYLRTRRLLPFIIAHWAADFLAILTGVVLPMMEP